ncbi:MAG: 4Fe-4S dicluster domain-containing protein [Bacteroidetes bacterium]|nr:4Fe-4S dicluster domain-containing protein [Bacteroidota bacterium]
MIRGTIIVAKDICKACELCIAACPQKCLELSSNLNIKSYRYVQLKNDTCTGCLNCAIVCPDAVITVYRQARPDAKQPEPAKK